MALLLYFIVNRTVSVELTGSYWPMDESQLKERLGGVNQFLTPHQCLQ